MDWTDVASAGLRLRDVAQSTSYGRPALKLRGKVIACEGKSDGHFVLMLDLARVDFLMEVEPAIFFQTPHYVGWPCVLARYGALPLEDLGALLLEAWERRAPRSLLQGGAARLP